jgi:uncharacterized protein (TIGR02145 family)
MKALFLLMLFFTGITTSISQPLKEVKIGTQIWTAQNLSVTKFANGENIPQAKTAAEWDSAGKLEKPMWCYYNFLPENGKKYGILYNWYAVNDKRGLAPKGYRIPTAEDWLKLVDFSGGIMQAGKKLKSATGWKNNGNGVNPNGFNGLPGGFLINNGIFSGLGETGGWWTSTEGEGSGAFVRYLEAEKNTSETYSDFKLTGFSVRCLKK